MTTVDRKSGLRRDRSTPSRIRHGILLLMLLFSVALLCFSFSCRQSAKGVPASGTLGGKAGAASQAVPVVTAAAYIGDIHLYITGMGTVTPLQTITVRTRVDGQLVKVLFREGQPVESGALLAVVDPRPYEAQVMQAVGQLARDQALLSNARIDLTRYEDLIKQKAIPEQQLATQQATVRQYEGIVTLDSGVQANAQVQLVYCRITAPITGTVGLRLVDPGNIIHASDPNGIAVITQMRPMGVIFSIPEDNLSRLLGKLQKNSSLAVEAYDRSEKIRLSEGRLASLDNEIDPTTGMVRCKAMFSNDKHQLFPGQFVNAHLLIDIKEGAVIVPQAALQKGPQGPYVYLVHPNKTVSMQPVAVGPGEGDLIAVDSGVAAGDLAVVEGADRLHEGAKVILPEEQQHSKGRHSGAQ